MKASLVFLVIQFEDELGSVVEGEVPELTSLVVPRPRFAVASTNAPFKGLIAAGPDIEIE